ncbi:MAG: DNA internalization-related competence protein ComEC/Rec2 [Oscillospiraceae bacterium]|nr:DNA internalization-related competence protein ComEC/Rec2 [Oscillospiraceae bacterium]
MRKLAWFSAGFGAACLWACYVDLGPVPVAIAAALLGLMLAVWLTTRPREDEHPILLRRPREKGPLSRWTLYQFSRRGLALCLGGVLAFGWAGAYFALFRAPAEQWVGDEVTISGEVSSYPAPTSIGGYSVTVHLDGGFFAPDALVYGSADWGGLKPGDHVDCTARVKLSTRAYGDETTYYTAKGVYLLAYCNDEPEITAAERVPFRHWPALCARKLHDGIYAAFDDLAAPIAAAVTLGDKTGLDDTLFSAFNRAGLMHAAVVSGFHISFLVQIVLVLCGKRRRVALAMIPLLVFYALMAGGTPSAFRAVIMQSALLAAPVAQREEDGPSALGLALLVLLIQNPFAAASVGLQLSFASVAGILLASRPLFQWMYRPLKPLRPSKEQKLKLMLWKAGRAALTSVSVSLGAMLFTVPLIALYFGQILLLSPVSNVLALWTLSLLMMCALILGTLAVFLPVPMAFLGGIAGLLGHYARWVALWLGRFPFASLSTDSRYCVIWLGAVYLALLAAFASREKPKRPLLCACGLIALLCAAIGFGRLEVETADLTVTALDVGQGSSTALLSGGRAALVDCGGDGSRSAGDVAADYFASMGRARLDLLVLTHFDSDHFNGVEQLFYRMKVDRVAVPGGDTDPEDAARLLELAEAEGAEVFLVDDTVELVLGKSSLTLFPPLGGGTSNESGLFALCSCQEFDTLITGDADAFVEKMLVKYCPIPDIELLVVGHHGSKYSSCEEFLRAAAPELAVISAGANNSYGHPAQETLERLEALGAETYRTDQEGTVTVRIQGDRVGVY